jgi:hypothetical protein
MSVETVPGHNTSTQGVAKWHVGTSADDGKAEVRS